MDHNGWDRTILVKTILISFWDVNICYYHSAIRNSKRNRRGEGMKSKVIELGNCFLKAHILSSGWIEIFDDEGNKITLGHFPNKRFDIIRKAIEYSSGHHNPNKEYASGGKSE